MHGDAGGGFSGHSGSHVGGGHGGLSAAHHHHHPGPSGSQNSGFPGLDFFYGRPGLRRPNSPASLRIVRAIVGLGVIAALLWVALH